MLLLLITLILHYDLIDCVIDEKANFNETALMRKHHENYIQVKTFIKDAELKFQDDKPTRVDHKLAPTRDSPSTDVRNWLFGNPSSVDPGNENHPYLPLGRSRPTFPDEITTYTGETKDHHLTLEEIIPNRKSETNESSSGIDFEITATNFEMSSVSLVNSKDRKGFKPVDFEIKSNSDASEFLKKEHFILKLSNPIQSRIHIDNAESSTLKFPTNLLPSSKVRIADHEYQKHFHQNESRARFLHPEFNLRRPMSNKSPSKKLTVDPPSHNFESTSTGEYRDQSTAELSRSRNPLDPPFKTPTSSIKYVYRFDPSLQTKEFILIVKPVPVTAKSSSLSSLKALKPYPKTIPTLTAKEIILQHYSKKTTKAKISSKTFKPSQKTLQSSDPNIKSSSAKTLKSFRPTYLESYTKALKLSRAKIFKSNILKPSPKKTQFIKPHDYSPILPHTKTTFHPKTLLREHSGEVFKFNTSLRRPNEVYKKKLVREITTYMPNEKWVLTLFEKIGLTTRKSFTANRARNLGRVSTRPHALVSSKQLKNTSKNQAINFLRQGPPRTRTMIEHLSTTTAEYEDYGLSTTSNNLEDHRIFTTTTEYEDYRPPTTTKEVEDYKLPSKLTNIGDYGLSTTPNNVEDNRISTIITEYENYSLTTMPNNIENHRLSTTAIEREDYRLPTMPINIDDHRLLTTTTDNIENHRLSTTTIEYDDYRLPTMPTNVKNHRLYTTTTEYEDYRLPTMPNNVKNHRPSNKMTKYEDYGLSTTTKEVEDDSLPTTTTNVEDHTLSTTVTNKPRFTIENHGGILHLITIPGDDEDAARVGRPGFLVEDEEMLEPLTTVNVRDRGPVIINTKDGMFRAQHLAAQKIEKTRRHLLKKKKKNGHHYHRHNTRQNKHKHRHRTRKNRKRNRKQKKQEMEYPLLYTDLRKRLSIGTPMKLAKENQSSEKLLNRETYPLKAIPELSHNDTVIDKVLRLTETQDSTPEFDNKNLYNKVKETLKQAQIRKEVERQKKKAELIRRIAEGSSYSDEEESLKRNLVQALQGNRTSEYVIPFI